MGSGCRRDEKYINAAVGRALGGRGEGEGEGVAQGKMRNLGGRGGGSGGVRRVLERGGQRSKIFADVAC